MAHDQARVRRVLAQAKTEGRSWLDPIEAKLVCDAYAIPVPRQALASSASEARRLADGVGYPAVVKIVSPDILHKTEAGGVATGLRNGAEVEQACERIIASATRYRPGFRMAGMLVQQMVAPAQEVIVGALTDPSFGKLVAFGLGGILVEALKDMTFRLAPATRAEALLMIDAIAGARILSGVRGSAPVDKDALAASIEALSQLVSDFPEIVEADLNPVFAGPDGVIAADVRIILDFAPPKPPLRPSQDEIIRAMSRIMKPEAIAVIGASAEEGKIGNAVMKNLVSGGYRGKIYPINPRATEILGLKSYRSVSEISAQVDLAIFTIPANLVVGAVKECGEKKVAGAVLIPSGFAEIGNAALQDELVELARSYNIRLMGPNIYGFYYTHHNLCATFCTAYDVKGGVALSSQSGGVGMAMVGFSRSTRMGVSAIIGLGNKADLDEDDLLTFFEQDDHTQLIAMHLEDLKDGRGFAEVARRVTRRKPVVVLKAGRTAAGARAARSHTAALAGDDKVYADVLRQIGVVRARSLNELLEFARCLPILPAPKGENVVIITGAGGSGVLLADDCSEQGLNLMTMPPDLDAAFRKFIPPFGAAGNPVDITGGEPPSTYRSALRLGLEEPRIHALILGYWHTLITPPMVFAKLVAEVVDECRRKGINKPVVASLVGDVEVEEACRYLFEHGVPAYPYTTDKPVAVLGAKYRWARGAGLL